MSQFYAGVSSGNLPPEVATSYVTQNGTAVPAANVLTINAIDSSENNDNGIISKGGVIGTGTANEIDLVLTNRITGSVSTTGVVTSTIMTFTPPVTEGVYDFSINICAWITAGQIGSTYQMLGAVKSDGLGTFATIGTPIRSMRGESGTFDVTQVDVSISGGSILVTATGLGATTIKWTGLMTYVFGGA